MGNDTSRHASDFSLLESAIDALLDQLHPRLGFSDMFSSPFRTGYVREYTVALPPYLKGYDEKRSIEGYLCKLQTDAKFLQALSLSMAIGHSGDENLSSKLHRVVDHIARDLTRAHKKRYMWKKNTKMLDVLRSLEPKMCRMMMEFGDSVPVFRVVEPGRRSDSESFIGPWSELMKATLPCLIEVSKLFLRKNEVELGRQIDSFNNDLCSFLDFVTSIVEVLLPSSDFVSNAISVATCVANRCCCFWFLATDETVHGKASAILDLHRYIDLDNSQVFLSCLDNLRALHVHNNAGGNGMRITTELDPKMCHPMSLFLSYLLRFFGVRNDLFDSLESILFLAVQNQAGVVGECEEFLMAVGFLFRPLAEGQQPDSCDILVKACLLKAEVILRQLASDLSRVAMLEGSAELRKIAEKLKNKEQALELVEQVAREMQCLGEEEKTTEPLVGDSVMVFLMSIVVFKARSLVMDSRKCSASVEEDRLFKQFQEGLQLFVEFLAVVKIEMPEDVTSVFIDAEEVCRSVTSLCYSYLSRKDKEEAVTEMRLMLPKMELVVSKTFPGFPPSDFPRINALGVVDDLLENLRELLIRDPDSVAAVRHYVEEIQVTVQSWRAFLTNLALDSDAAEHLGFRNLADQATCVAYKVADVIDLIVINGHRKHVLWLHNLVQEMRIINRQLPTENQEVRPSSYRVDNNVVRLNVNRGEMVESRRDQELAIINELLRGSRRREEISIVGMPGIGKTTLAKKVYNDPNVVGYFNRRAWCCVSQVYGKRELLLDILKDIHSVTDAVHQMSDSDLELKLYRLLKGYRYLIVMDDLWDVGALNDLVYSFADDGNGSRILITSRLHKVALDARPSGGDPHALLPLSEEESWNLLEMKVFQREESAGCCPEELVEVGKKIARACKGLPLSVVAVAGILRREEETVDCWSKIAKNLSLQIIDDPQTQCKDIIEFSYMHLPPHLRECFLYIGAFLEDRNVSVSKLIRLWIAEGFIDMDLPGPNRSLEERAEDYLTDLIGRSLVMVSRKRSNGMVKSCSIHDLLRDFCLAKAKVGNFFHLITQQDEPYASFDGVDYGDELYHHCVSNPVTYHSYRVGLHLKRKHFVDSRPSGPWTRSLALFASTDADPKCHYDISFISQSFRLLTVLNMECININSGFPSDIGSMLHLRYLAVSGNASSVPGSIANVRKLETLIVKGSSDKIVLPGTIWLLTKLRHLHVKNCATFSLQDDLVLELHNLVTFSSPALSSGMENIIARLPNLRKLSCIFCKSRSNSLFPDLHSLTRLESLRIRYSGTALSSAEFSLPASVKKLTLSNFSLPWSQIDGIAKLPNLEVLKLVCGAFAGIEWDMREIGFSALKFLTLDSLNIAKWSASSDNLPRLQKLVIKNCKELEEVPYDFAEIDTLEMIEIQQCRKAAEQSAISIRESSEAVRVIIS